MKKKAIVIFFIIVACMSVFGTTFAVQRGYRLCPRCGEHGVPDYYGRLYDIDENGLTYYNYICNNGHHYRVYPR